MSTRAATARNTRNKGRPTQEDLPHDKENNAQGISVSAVKTTSKSRAKKTYCLCRQPDDKLPMILCSECNEWYHFGCVDLKEEAAEDIHVYVCPPCTQNTGLHTVMEWEGPEALEKRSDESGTTAQTKNTRHGSVAPTETSGVPSDAEKPESSYDGSEDEYVAELTKTKGKGKRRTRRVSIADSDESDLDNEHKARRIRRVSMASKDSHKKSKSPIPAKRKQSTASVPDSKRQRSMSTTGEDVTRKYCLLKLGELFTHIFMRYPALVLGQEHTEGEEPKENSQTGLTPEEKEVIEGRAKQFTAELEESLFDMYHEPDRHGNPATAGAKYKERFRMLQFNLSQEDRVNIHTRIASSQVTARELVTMSSTDLANDEIKQSIKQAEEESLAHSILKKVTLPRAKMTHKGIQDIEDMNGTAREREQGNEQDEDDDRMERERLARLRVQTQRAQQIQEASVAPESPVTAQTPAAWGGPPPLPSHASHSHDLGPSPTSARPPANPMFAASSSELVTSPVEGELNLADLINIDDEGSSDMSLSISIPPPPVKDSSLSADAAQVPSAQGPVSTTALSPFAARPPPELTSRPSFDLNALWSPEGNAQANGDQVNESSKPEEPHAAEELREVTPGVEDTDVQEDELEDQDFDMFLGGNDDEHVAPAPPSEAPPPAPPTFESLPVVWSGKISMPLDSTIPQEVSLVARQSGGRSIAPDSLLWQILFPNDHLRIDGRVPTANSAQYLTQSRLNTAKELIAVTFSPESEASKAPADSLLKYLIGKGRHGLIFPWGNRPKEHHPGKELYIVPLLTTDPLPDYMELIDDLQLPKTRTSDYLVGIWVLNKGKLVPPPTPPAIPVPNVPPTFAQPGIPLPLGVPMSGPHPLPIPSIPPPQPEGAAANLANQVASLSPEQIQMMLRSLGSVTGAPSALPSIPPLVPPPHQPWNGSPHPQVHSQPRYQAPPPPPGVGLPPQPHQSASMSPPRPYPPGGGGGAPYDYDGYDRPPFDRDRPPYPGPPRGGPHSGRSDRGPYRGRGGDRGSGRSAGGGPGGRGARAGGDFSRPRDSGWKGRGRGRGGPDAASSVRDGGRDRRWDQ